MFYIKIQLRKTNNRLRHLKNLAYKYRLDFDEVFEYASLLGKREDYDALPILLEEAAWLSQII